MEITNDKKYVINNDILMQEWNWEKNNQSGLDPNFLVEGSHKKAWWTCRRGHEWDMTIRAKAHGGQCPYCSGRRVLEGFNDLSTTHPNIALEWDYEKNNGLLPTQVSYGSTKKIWWTCQSGHEFQQTVNHRTSSNGVCPVCQQEMRTSFPEQAIYFYLKQVTVAKNREIIFGKEVDVFLPKYNYGIEYDGKRFHSSDDALKRERDKNHVLNSNGISIFRIKESQKNFVDNNIIYYKYDVKYSNLTWAIIKLFDLLKLEKTPNIDFNKDRISIYEQYINSIKEHSLLVTNPEIAKQWNYNKNGVLRPDLVTSGSDKKVWWICEAGHEWESKISNRVHGRGCPICSNKKVVVGINDLTTLNPELMLEWDYCKNNMNPAELSTGSKRKVWWKCKDCGYEWQAAVHTRNKGHGCPMCARLRQGPRRKNENIYVDITRSITI